MNTRHLVAGIMLAVATALAPSAASAATINFGAAPWNGAHNLESFSVPGVATADADPANATLYHTPGVGLGVNFGILPLDPGEIETIETLRITFAAPTVVTSFTVTQLMAGEGAFCGRFFCSPGYNERGAFTLSDGTSGTFEAAHADGTLTVNVGGGAVSWIQFSVPNVLDLRHDYSVLAIETVPEPASLAVLGLGLAGLATRLRRRR